MAGPWGLALSIQPKSSLPGGSAARAVSLRVRIGPNVLSAI